MEKNSLSPPQWSFTTKIPPEEVTLIGDTADPSSTFLVDWEAELELRSWGIKHIYARVNRVTGSLRQDDDAAPFDLALTPGTFDIEAVFTQYPSSLTIDLKRKTILVE